MDSGGMCSRTRERKSLFAERCVSLRCLAFPSEKPSYDVGLYCAALTKRLLSSHAGSHRAFWKIPRKSYEYWLVRLSVTLR